MTGPWREPEEETVGLYPGLVVADGRMSGSITVGRSRLPLWAIVGSIPADGWNHVVSSWDYIETDPDYAWTADKMGAFLRDLMEARGEFARLLLILADAERLERWDRPWWATKRHRKQVRDQLIRCLATLEDQP